MLRFKSGNGLWGGQFSPKSISHILGACLGLSTSPAASLVVFFGRLIHKDVIVINVTAQASRIMYEYTNNGPVDSSIGPDLSKLKNKSVVITGGTNSEVY
jgi:hypothetical protein